MRCREVTLATTGSHLKRAGPTGLDKRLHPPHIALSDLAIAKTAGEATGNFKCWTRKWFEFSRSAQRNIT